VGCHAARGRRGALLQPVGGAPTASRPTATQARHARAARLCFGQVRVEVADGRAPMAVGAGGRGEARAASERALAGPRRKRGGRAQMNSVVLDLFKLV
jgi:hypothetical protein